MSASPVEITSVNVEALLSYCINNCEVLLVDFYAPWCGPCKQMEAPLERLAASGAASVVKINGGSEDAGVATAVDRVMSAYRVTAFPTILVFKQKILVQTVVGANLAQLMAAIA